MFRGCPSLAESRKSNCCTSTAAYYCCAPLKPRNQHGPEVDGRAPHPTFKVSMLDSNLLPRCAYARSAGQSLFLAGAVSCPRGLYSAV